MRLNELVKREQERELQRILQQAKLDKKHLSKGSEWGLNSHATANHATNHHHNNNEAACHPTQQQQQQQNQQQHQNTHFNKSQSTYNLNSNQNHQKK